MTDSLRTHRYLLIVLALMSMFDCLGIDMYMPAFGHIQADLGLTASQVGLTLSVFMLGLGMGQLIFGPLSDRIGRKPPLMWGLVLMALASVVVAASDHYGVILAARWLQGLGGAAGLVIPRAVTGDLFDEKEAVRAFTFLMLVQCITPVLAPGLGYVLLVVGGWRSMFVCVALLGAAAVLLVALTVRETLTAQQRKTQQPTGALKAVLVNARFWSMTAASCACYGTLFAYLTAAHTLCVDLLGTSLEHFTVYFVLTSAGLVLVGWVSLRIARRLPLVKNLSLGFAVHVSVAALMLLAAALNAPAWLIECVLFAHIGTLSLVFGPLTTEVMFSVPKAHAGSASAILGALQYGTAAVAGVLVLAESETSILYILSLLAAFSVASLICWCTGRACINRRHVETAL